MKLVLGQDARVLEWMTSRVRGFGSKAASTTIGFERNGELVCGAVFHGLFLDLDGKPNDIEVTGAFDNSAGLTGAGLLRAVFGYAFGQLGVRRITVHIASDNDRSVLLVERLGFKKEGALRDAVSPGIDLLAFGMKRGECRFWSK